MRKIAALILTLSVAPAVWAADCEMTIEANDAMQYNVKEMTVPKSCAQYTVHLKHIGKQPKTVMGHNWVLTKAADAQPFSTDALKAGPAKDYMLTDDERVIAYTDMVGGGEEHSVTFDVSKLTEGEEYTYFCTFPGHFVVMHGPLKVQ